MTGVWPSAKLAVSKTLKSIYNDITHVVFQTNVILIIFQVRNDNFKKNPQLQQLQELHEILQLQQLQLTTAIMQ